MCELFWEVKCNPHQLLSARMPVAIFCAFHAFCTISMVSRVSFVFADLLELALWATSESCEVSASFGPLLFFQQHHIHRPLWNTLQTCITWNLESMPCIASATPWWTSPSCKCGSTLLLDERLSSQWPYLLFAINHGSLAGRRIDLQSTLSAWQRLGAWQCSWNTGP